MTYFEQVESLRKTFRSKRTKPYEWRIAQLRALKRFLTEHKQEICDALWQDLHKGRFETDITEIDVVLSEIEFALMNLSHWMEPETVFTALIAQPGHSHVHRDPYGVVLIIGAWNYPIQLLLAPLVGALAAGNAAVLKPSEIAAATSRLIAKEIPKYLDSEAVLVIEGGIAETDDLLNATFDYIFFTGSGPVGKIVMKKAAEHLTPVTLELGGKSPAIVMDDADIRVAARRIAWGKFMNGGQTCIAPDYVLIHKAVEDAFLDALKIAINDFYGTDAKQSDDYCRIINEKNFRRLSAFLQDGELIYGGQTDATELYIEPTILRLNTADVPVMKEEIFGPILPVIGVEHITEAIQFVNDRPKPLALYFFSKNELDYQKIVDETSSGGVCVNDVILQMPSPYMPFGGVGASGMGNYHGKQSFETFSHRKSVLTKSTWLDLPIRYAPYTDSKLKWMERLS